MKGLAQTFTVGIDVRDVVFSPDQTKLYVARGDGSIEIIDVETQTSLGKWTVAPGLTAISISVDGSFLLATDPTRSVVLRISATTGEVITSYPGFSGAFLDVEIIDESSALVTGGGGSVRLDLATGAMTPIANSAYYSATSVLAEDDHLTLFAELGISNGPLAIFDDRTGTVTARGDNYQGSTTGFNNGIQAISEKAGLVLQFIYYSSINIYDLQLKLIKTVNLGSNATGLTFDQTGQFVYVHHTEAVVKYELSTWTQVESYPLSNSDGWGSVFWGNQLQITDDGRFMTVADDAGTLRLIDLRPVDEVLIGSLAADALFGGGGADIVQGGGGEDVLGSAGMRMDALGRQAPGLDLGREHDVVSGGDGNDFIGAGYGDDVDGGAGNDRLSLSLDGATSCVTLTTRDLLGGQVASLGGGTIQGIESLQELRGSRFADVITVSGQVTAPVIDGGKGDDLVISTGGPVIFRGGVGDDLFVNGTGMDTFDGGDGFDTIDYRNASTGVELHLNPVAGQSTVGPGGDAIVNVEGVNGSSFGDVLMGSNGTDRLNGLGGDDRIDGRLGGALSAFEIISGGDGNDTVTVSGAQSGRYVQADGGAGTDTLVIAHTAGQFFGAQYTGFERLTLQSGVNFQNLSGFSTITLGSGFFNVLDSANPDADIVLSGQYLSLVRSSFRSVTGSDGADTLVLASGTSVNTAVLLGAGTDRLNLDYSVLGQAITVPGADGGSGTDSLGVGIGAGQTRTFDLTGFSNFESFDVNRGLQQVAATLSISHLSGVSQVDAGTMVSL